MATSTDLNWEENLVAHWMSDVSRAGVILSPAFPNLKITRGNSFENSSLSLAVNSLHSSSSTSLSEDSLHKRQAFRPGSPCEEMLDTSKILFPNSLAKKDPMLVVQDAPDPLTVLQTDPECDKLEDLGEKHRTDLLLQKLEQLKGLQQHKQEQLRRQQMDQIQRLMEEQQKLLSRVSEQQTHSGCHDDSVHLDSVSHISSPVEQEDSLEKFKNGQVLKESLSEKESLDMSFNVKDELEIEDQNAITGGKNLSPEENLLEYVDGDISFEGKVYAETSKISAAEKCSDSLNAEERPILATIQERKQTFEEFLEEQIRLEEQRLSQHGNLKDTGKSAFQKPVAKRPFLKRGEGLIRFTNAKSKIAKQKESKEILHPDIAEVNNIVKANKQQLHRKTAPSNKGQVSDNFISRNSNQNVKTKKGFTARKTAALKNCTVKGISLCTRENSNEKKGELRKSVRPQINDEHKNNKENITAPAALSETDMLPGEKPEELLEPIRCLTNSFEKDPDLSFELSFQRKLENWETEKERERNELDEFLFLEQAAAEISFASNSSLIVRILDQGQQISAGHRLSSTPVKSRHQQMHVLDITAVNSRNGEQYISQQDNSEKTREAVVGNQACEASNNHQNETDRKILQDFPTEEFHGFRNTSWDDEDRSDRSSGKTSESEEEFETTIKPVSERVRMLALNNRGNIPEFSECEGNAKALSREATPDLQGKDSCSDQANEINRTLMSENICYANSSNIEFDDETSWSDLEENGNQCAEVENSDLVIKLPLPSSGSTKNESVFPDKVIKRKIAMVKKGDVIPKQTVTAPPTTDLMLKLFPSLKPRQKVDAQQKHDAKPNTAQEESGGDSAHSQLLRQKLLELETEIERFRVENASLTKLREERENAMENLRKEIANFEQQKIKELAQIEEFKKEETQKLQKERKVFEKYAQAARAIPDKKERDEIQALKEQIATLQGDLRRRETKWSTTHMRLRDQIETLTKENMQLREEVKIMERCRLEAWKRKEASANKKKTDGYSYTKRAGSVQSTAILQKSQTLSSVHQAEKNSKTNGKSDSSSEGRPFAKPKPAATHNESSSDNTTKHSEDVSKTFMVVSKNLPASGLVDSASIVTSESSDNEDRMVEREATHPDGKVEKIFKNGCHLIIFPNGTRKEVSCDGKITTVSFFNGDIKQILEDQRVIYYYADAKTTHTTYPTGLEVLHFSNGQIEKHFPDGRKEIVFPDQTIKNVFTDGREVNIFPDGTTVRIQQDGSRIIEFSNGQQEVHTAHFKRREYPDGTIKTVYADGRQETQYASGRVRVKDKDGAVIMDTLQ